MDHENNSFGIAALSIVPIRAEASERSEQVSQLLFGETFDIFEQEGQWLRIAGHYDGYEGWVDPKLCSLIPIKDKDKYTSPVPDLAIERVNLLKKDREEYHLLAGSTLVNFDGLSVALGNERYNYFGKSAKAGSEILTKNLDDLVAIYLNAPYLWGGRTPFGIDCSGFTQMIYKFLGIRLKRDAWQQAEQGRLVNFVEETAVGDLAFFDNEEEQIIHVGIILPDERIVHASGKVRIDKIDHHGIFNITTKRYSHKLRIIRRLL